jgi:O-acetyl-ADP-ribose deacetylase (regulator of RNase III)
MRVLIGDTTLPLVQGDISRQNVEAIVDAANNSVSGEAQLPASAYHNSRELAAQHGIGSITLPALSTGAYRYPVRDATQIALSTVIEYLHPEKHELQTVRFILFDSKTFETCGTILRRIESSEAGG